MPQPPARLDDKPDWLAFSPVLFGVTLVGEVTSNDR
jgi:hypothetical protein